MKEKLIKKYQSGDPIESDPTARKAALEQQLILQKVVELYYKEHPEEREKLRHGQFAFQPIRYKEGVLPYVDASTGRPILNGENVLTRNGTIVTGQSLDWLDWLAETGLVLPGQNLPELQVEYNKKTKDTSTRVGEDWDTMNERKENAPIATNAQWEELALENFETNDLIKLLMQKRLADRIANQKTPGVGSLALLGTLGTMAVWNPVAFAASLGAAKLGEATLNYPFLQYGYNSFGNWLFDGTNAPEWLKENSNLGALLGGGFGWTVGKNLTSKLGLNLIKSPTLLADKYAPLWAADEALIIANKNFLNNYYARMPLYIEDVPAVELSSTPITSIKPQRSGVFYAKVGDVNKGSVLSLAVHNLKKAFNELFSNDPIWNLMERAGIPEELSRSVRVSLFGKKIPDEGKFWTDPMTGVKHPIADPNMTDDEIIKLFSEGMKELVKRFKSPEFKSLVQKEMGWGDLEYNLLMLEIDDRLRARHSVIVKGIDELQQGYTANAHVQEDGSVLYTINRDRVASTPFETVLSIKSSGSHELYHGLTGGIRGTNQPLSPTQIALANKYPRLTLIMDHNANLLKNFEFNRWVDYFVDTPVQQLKNDLRNAGFTEKQIEDALEVNIPRVKSFKNYINTNQETSARSTTASKFGSQISDYDDLAQFYTPESLEQSKRLLSKIGDINKGSAVGTIRRPILRKNMHLFSDAEWDAAYIDALSKGNKREMWRLLTLRFLLKAKEYIANGGGDPKVLYRGDWRDYFLNFKKDGVWLSSDPLYALNYTEDRIARDKVFLPLLVRKYFVKGHQENLLPRFSTHGLSREELRKNSEWTLISDYLSKGSVELLRKEVKDLLTHFNAQTTTKSVRPEFILELLDKSPVLKRKISLGTADIISGEDLPVAGEHGFEHWNGSQGLEYYVANPNYVKSAQLITYDDVGNMIPLSLRFNFGRNDRRYGWLLPLVPFLYPNEKD